MISAQPVAVHFQHTLGLVQLAAVQGNIAAFGGHAVKDTEDDVFPGGQGGAQEYTQQEVKQHSNKVVNINATTQLSVVLVKPEKFENAVDIADHLREKRTVVLNLEQTNKDVARRLVDFLSGVTYAQDGKIKKVANSTFIITPYNVDILGDLIDELENNGLYI